MSFDSDQTAGVQGMQVGGTAAKASLLSKLLGSRGAGTTDDTLTAGPMVNNPTTKKPKAKSQVATFLGSDAVPGAASGNFGGQTLLGG